MYAAFLEELLRACKSYGLHTTVDTVGNGPFENFIRILPFTDLFLYDVKCFDSEKHEKFTGVENTLILENLKKLLSLKKDVWVRIPVIGGVNDTGDDMEAIKAFISSCGTPKKIDLLPYHEMGNHKYTALGKEAQTFTVPDEEKMNRFNDIFRDITAER